MALFLGTYTPRLDDKARFVLPAKFREQLAEGLVVTRGQEHCLYVFPIDEFTRITDEMRKAPVTSRAARDFMRVFLSGASDEVPDRQGRVSLPQHLRTYAGIEREVAVVGAGSRLEIWDSALWESYLAGQEQSFAEMSEEVLPGLI